MIQCLKKKIFSCTFRGKKGRPQSKRHVENFILSGESCDWELDSHLQTVVICGVIFS